MEIVKNFTLVIASIFLIALIGIFGTTTIANLVFGHIFQAVLPLVLCSIIVFVFAKTMKHSASHPAQ